MISSTVRARRTASGEPSLHAAGPQVVFLDRRAPSARARVTTNRLTSGRAPLLFDVGTRDGARLFFETRRTGSTRLSEPTSAKMATTSAGFLDPPHKRGMGGTCRSRFEIGRLFDILRRKRIRREPHDHDKNALMKRGDGEAARTPRAVERGGDEVSGGGARGCGRRRLGG